LGAGVVRPADAREPTGAAAQDGRRDGDALDIVHGRRAAPHAGVRRERRLQARLTFLAFEAFEQRGFFAADISARTVMHIDVKGIAVDVVLAHKLGGIGFIDRALQRLALADEFTAHIYVTNVRAHREAGDQAALDE